MFVALDCAQQAVKTWSICSRIRNKLMHILFGNSPEHSSKNAINICVANTNGLSKEGRWEQILERCKDVTILSETHCTAVMQKALPYSAKDFHVFWGAPVNQGSRSGVAFLVRKGSFWNVRPISFDQSPCLKRYNDGRLHAVQVFYNKGERSIIIYGIYGVAGARWEQVRKDAAEAMYQDIAQDIISRGSIPACVAGDFNVQIQESRLLQKYINTGTWIDAANYGSTTEQAKLTSHKNNGSRIDMMFANPFAAELITNYRVKPGVLPQDHSEVHVQMSLPVGAQCRYIPCQPNNHNDVPYDNPTPHHTPPHIDSVKPIRPFLQVGDIDGAFQAWCHLAQAWLCRIPHTCANHVTYDNPGKRGCVRFQKQCAFPKQVAAHSLNIHCRKIAMALARVHEILRTQVWGTQVRNTWYNLNKVKPSLPQVHHVAFQEQCNKGLSRDTLIALEQLLQLSLHELQTADKKNRIQAWKRKLAKSEKFSYQWLKNKQHHQDIIV